MRLAAPLFLAALALLVPVLVAFLVRRQRRHVRVPSTMVWRLGAKSVAKNRRVRDLRRLIALLACLGGVAALVVAAARPSGSRGDARVYVVDVSASMSGEPLRDARRWLARDIAARGPSASIAIVLAGSEPRVALAPSAPGPQVDAAIQSVTAEKDDASIGEAIALAEGLAAADDARVVVLTDHPIEGELSARPTKPEQRLFARSGKPDNVGITGLYTRPSPDARDDEERDATIMIATSSTAARRVHLVVSQAGRVIVDRRVEIPEHGEATEHVLVRGAGRLVARVAPDDRRTDALSIDDEASLEESIRRPPRVAFVRDRDESAAGYFIEKSLRAAGIIDLVEVGPDEPAPSTAEIAVVLRDGAGRPANVPSFLIGVEPKELATTARVIEKPDTHLRSIAFEDPLLRGVSLDDMTTLRARVFDPPRGARTLVDLDGGPALIAGGSGANAWVWLGIDPEASDLVLRVAFPVLVGNVLAHLGGAAQIVSAPTVARAEVMLDSPGADAPFPTAAEPRWRLPVAPPVMLAILGAVLLSLEAWLTFRKRWAI